MDRSTVRFGREMTDRVDLQVIKQKRHQLLVTDITGMKHVAIAGLLGHVRQAVRIPRIGQLIEVDDTAGVIRIAQHVADEIRRR